MTRPLAPVYPRRAPKSPREGPRKRYGVKDQATLREVKTGITLLNAQNVYPFCDAGIPRGARDMSGAVAPDIGIRPTATFAKPVRTGTAGPLRPGLPSATRARAPSPPGEGRLYKGEPEY
ncbi:hypothetical protein Pisl_1199 [Pyrobaculum islandicum DSM 4184]|uniref:Uncharacterized protein n=1 Tax=Pyrobaculum islandicum (strain DSM 4184 / JCM 9189 / GEO3) TaxID=384616 RepID=A1RTT4_PYRIL|nr:hypothetical protein Pisl_1199 [Pyrobaculum islandicum DSM 4184]